MFGVQPKRIMMKKAHSQPSIHTSASAPQRRPLPWVTVQSGFVLH